MELQTSPPPLSFHEQLANIISLAVSISYSIHTIGHHAVSITVLILLTEYMDSCYSYSCNNMHGVLQFCILQYQWLGLPGSQDSHMQGFFLCHIANLLQYLMLLIESSYHDRLKQLSSSYLKFQSLHVPVVSQWEAI